VASGTQFDPLVVRHLVTCMNHVSGQDNSQGTLTDVRPTSASKWESTPPTFRARGLTSRGPSPSLCKQRTSLSS
jgi:hypothetical protein